MIAGTVKPSKRKRDWVSYFMEETPLRSIMFSQAKKMVTKNSGGHYPAPYAIINLLENSNKYKVRIALLSTYETYLTEETNLRIIVERVLLARRGEGILKARGYSSI